MRSIDPSAFESESPHSLVCMIKIISLDDKYHKFILELQPQHYEHQAFNHDREKMKIVKIINRIHPFTLFIKGYAFVDK